MYSLHFKPRCEQNTIFVTTQALVLGHQVCTFPKFLSEEIDWHGQTVGQSICSCSVLGLPGK